MKKPLIVLFFVSFNSLAQKPDILPLQWNEEEIFHQSVIEFPSLSSDQVFTLTKIYLSETFKNYKEVVNIEDKELGVISGRGITSASYVTGLIADSWDIHFSFKYEIKDEKVRVTFDHFEFSLPTQPRPTEFEFLTFNALTKKPVAKVTKAQKQIFEDFGNQLEAMNAKLIESAKKSEDW